MARILIVDDQEMILRAVRTLLESKSPFEVCGTAFNGSEAVIKARDLHPDVIILDLAMPVMNGIDAAREISRMQPETPILLYTMSDLPQVRREAARVGIREVVGKSAGPQVLLDAVERALHKVPIIPEGSGDQLPLVVTPIDGNNGAESQLPDDSRIERSKAS